MCEIKRRLVESQLAFLRLLSMATNAMGLEKTADRSIGFHAESSITTGKTQGKNCGWENSMKHVQSVFVSCHGEKRRTDPFALPWGRIHCTGGHNTEHADETDLPSQVYCSTIMVKLSNRLTSLNA